MTKMNKTIIEIHRFRDQLLRYVYPLGMHRVACVKLQNSFLYKPNENNSMLMYKTGFRGPGILSLGKFRLFSGRAK